MRMRCLVPRVCRRSVFSDLLQHSSKLLVLAPSFICLPSLAVLLLLAGNYESIVHFAEGKDLVCLHLRHVRRDIRGYFDQCEACPSFHTLTFLDLFAGCRISMKSDGICGETCTRIPISRPPMKTYFSASGLQSLSNGNDLM